MDLNVDLGPMSRDDHLGRVVVGLRSLYEQSELCDVVLVVAGESFLAHRSVLAAVSSKFHEVLTKLGSSEWYGSGAEPKSLVVQLDDISHPEAVKAMLDCIYRPGTDYAPSSEDANRDVLRLAQRFCIAQLEGLASRWLATGLSSANVLDRLLACEEFALASVRDGIMAQLMNSPEELLALAKDPKVTGVPTVLQDLLVRIMSVLVADAKAETRAEAKPQGAPQRTGPGRPGKRAGA